MLAELRHETRQYAVDAGRPDLVAALDDLLPAGPDTPVRVMVAGETKRGKSTLVNTLVGRPLLSPVGTDVTTGCWVEFAWGDKDSAVALLADPSTPGTPRRVRLDVREVERYVAVAQTTEPVLGVEVRVPSAMLADLVLVDTPGVGGLRAGHSAITLAALKRSDALLFVCDATQPVLAPEVEFLAAAALRVPTIAVAVTKCDANPGFDEVVAETRERLAEHRTLAGVPVFAIAAPLADHAAEIEDDAVSARLTELSGITELMTAIKSEAKIGGAALRRTNAARSIGTVARVLAWHTRESATVARGDDDGLRHRVEQLSAELADKPATSQLIRRRLADLPAGTLHSFRTAARKIHAGYRTEAERGPAAQLTTLAPRMAADLTSCCADALESVAEETRHLLRRVLGELGAGLPLLGTDGFDLGLNPPDLPDRGRRPQLTSSIEVFKTVVGLAGAVPVVLSVVPGVGVLAAGIVLAACAGWWQLRGEGEQQRRAHLRTWVDTALADAVTGFEAELHRSVRTVEQHLDTVVPEILAARRGELVRLQHELAAYRAATEHHRRTAQAALDAKLGRLTAIAARADEIARTRQREDAS